MRVQCEHASEGGANLRYVGVFLPHAIAACADSSAEVRQAAAYGLGQVAQRGGESVHPHIPQIMQALSSLIQVRATAVDVTQRMHPRTSL